MVNKDVFRKNQLTCIILCLLLCNVKNATAQQLLSVTPVNRQPYIRYEVALATDTVTFYLSEFDREKSLPLVVYIQGSGNSSLFSADATGRIAPRSGHITFADNIRQKAKLLIVEKPGVHFLDNSPDNVRFDSLFSLDKWAANIMTAISYVTGKEKINRSKIMIAGHSEGGVVAAKIAATLKEKVSHTCILAGEGTTQLYSLFKLAEDGTFFNNGNKNEAQRKDSLLQVWKAIAADPASTEKKFWGFTYKRWSSFLNTSVYDELSSYNGNILIIQGDADKNVYPESAKVLYTGLLSKNKKVNMEMIPGADHSFNITAQPQINGWQNVITECITWFLGTL